LLYSYLVDRPVHLNDIYSRADDSTTQFWTLPYVPGRRLGGHTPVWVLTSAATFSAAEEFAYDVQQHGRGLVVGERTRGGAHPCDQFRIDAHLVATIPVARSINPVSGTNWEGVGVSPDIEVPAADAYPVALRQALNHVLDLPADPGNEVHAEARQALTELAAAYPANAATR
jgi:C-terminal processing protease CtpA/Prc